MNFSIPTPNELLEDIQKPKLKATDVLALAPSDWLIVAAGFEDRAIAALQCAAKHSSLFGVIIITYSPFVSENKTNLLRSLCLQHHLPFHELLYDRQQPAGIGKTIVDRLGAYAGHIFIDVSGMSRLLIVQLLVAFSNRPFGFDNCTIIYTEAETYPPSEEEALTELQRSEDDPTIFVLFLSSQVFEITVLPELSSVAIAGAQTRLITFPSFDAHHLTALRVELQPARYSFVEGIPPLPANQWRTTMIARINRTDEFRDAELCSASTLEYSETLLCLLNLYKRHAIRDRLLIAPTGSKMQTVAVGLFRSFIRDVQIVYPTPSGFRSPERYTQGVGPMYKLELSKFALPKSQDLMQVKSA